MNLQELATAVYYRLPVKVAIINNSCLGMVRQWQELFYNRRYSQTLFEQGPEFAHIAEAFGARGIKVEKPERVRDAIQEALDTEGPVIMDFRVKTGENVFPMVAPNEPISKFMDRGDA